MEQFGYRYREIMMTVGRCKGGKYTASVAAICTDSVLVRTIVQTAIPTSKSIVFWHVEISDDGLLKLLGGM
jgi:hypothetical protein